MTIKYIRKSQCEVMDLDQAYMVMDLEQYTVTELNNVGGFCWDRFSEAQSVADIVEAVRKKFQTAPPSLEEDIESFIAGLVECGLIEPIQG